MTSRTPDSARSSTRDDALPRGRQRPGLGKAATLGLAFACLAASLSRANGQLDPAEMQRQVQQQMGGGGSCGGGGGATPNRIGQLVSAAGASSAAIARSAIDHPRAAIATTAATATTVWVGVESQRSGILVCRSPRTSLFRPSDKYLTWVLETAADAPIASPLRGVILSPIPSPEAEEESEEGELPTKESAGSRKGIISKKLGGAKSRRTVGSGGKRRTSTSLTEEAGETGVGAFEIQQVLDRAREVEAAGVYIEETRHGKGGKVKSVCAGVRVGTGLGLYHKFAQGLKNLDVFDGRSDCELMAAETSPEDVGSTLVLLTRPGLSTWSLSPLRIVLHRESSSPVPRVELEDSGRRGSHRRGGRKGGRRRRRKDKESEEKEKEEQEPEQFHLQYTLGLSAVEGAGWSGTWVFRVTYDAETENVWFQTSLAQRKGSFGTTAGGDQVARVKRVNEDMLKRGNKHAAVLRTRAEQFTRVSALARSRARDAKELQRDRVLNPDKYKRVHRYMREDSHTIGGASARPARWGEERRRNDIRLK